jgi:hypothetical protein
MQLLGISLVLTNTTNPAKNSSIIGHSDAADPVLFERFLEIL